MKNLQKQLTTRKYSYKVVFDCLVTDDVIEKTYHNCTYDEMVAQAMEYSKSPYLSFGNFDIYHSEDEVYELTQQLENSVRYDVYQADMLRHRQVAKEQTIKTVVRQLRLDLVALREIAEATNDIRTKNQLSKRLDHLERFYNTLKGDL